jgi:hypothetical protein
MYRGTCTEGRGIYGLQIGLYCVKRSAVDGGRAELAGNTAEKRGGVSVKPRFFGAGGFGWTDRLRCPAYPSKNVYDRTH